MTKPGPTIKTSINYKKEVEEVATARIVALAIAVAVSYYLRRTKSLVAVNHPSGYATN